MANGIISGLEGLLGIDTNAGTAELQQAIAALQAVGVPTAEQLNLPELQKYVKAGVLTPQQYQAIMADPDTYSNTIQQTADNSGSNAQKAALQQLGSVVQAGGSTPINEANLRNNINQTNQAMQAARQGIMQNAQERNASGNGLEFINQLMNEQSNASNANMGAVNAGANNAKLALEALTQQGQLGGQLQGQSNQMAQAQAEAARQIAEYNSQLRSQANQYNTETANNAMAANLQNAQDIGNRNTETANQRSMYNAQVPQTIYQDKMQKAQGMAGAYGNMGQLKQQQAQQQAAFTGNLIGAGATVAGGMAGGPAGAAAGGQMGRSATPPPPQISRNYNDNPWGNYAHGGIVEERSQPEMPLQAPHDMQEATEQMSQHTPGRLQQILHRVSDTMKNAPVHANIRPGFAGLTYTKRFAHGGEVDACHGGMCYAQGGEVHDHRLCMQAGGDVPGDESDMQPMMDDESQDTVPANLSPGEVVLPRSVSQAPDAPQQAAQFVGQLKGQSPTVNSFAEVLQKLEENGLELRLAPRGQ